MHEHTSAHPPVDHDPRSCPGCNHILDLDDLVVVLDTPKQTLYKRSALSFPGFPRRLRDRRSVAVRCTAVRDYLEAVER